MKPVSTELEEMAQKYGYCGLFATPKDPEELNQRLDDYIRTIPNKHKTSVIVVMGLLTNYMALEIGKRDRLINKLKGRTI